MKKKQRKNKLDFLEEKNLVEDAFLKYLEHVKEGHSFKSFYYENEGVRICYQTWQKYLEERPDLFDPILVRIAISKGMKKWERVVFDGSLGRAKGINVPLVLSVMKNKYGWDEVEKSQSTSGLNCVVNLRPWPNDNSRD